MSWYENNKKYDIDTKSIMPTGALVGKAIGDSFKDIAQIIDDREKTNMEKAKHDKEMAKLGYENNKLEDEENNRKSTKELEEFTDEKGNIDKDGYTAKTGKNIKSVPLEARKNIYNMNNEYKKNESLKAAAAIVMNAETEKEAREQYNKWPEELKNNLSFDEALKLIANQNKLDNDKANKKLEQDKFEMEKNEKANSKDNKDINVGYYNAIFNQVAKRFNGIFNDDGTLRALAKGTEKMVTAVAAIAERIYKADPKNGIAGSVALAVQEYEQGAGNPQEAKTLHPQTKQNLTKADNKGESFKRLDSLVADHNSKQ